MMKRVCRLMFVLLLALSPVAQGSATTFPSTQEIKRVTLYSPNKYKDDSGRFLFSFKTGMFVRELDDWDLIYGSLYVGDDWDWFSVSTARDARNAFRDLGALDWTDSFTVPLVTPFPKLKEGEQRMFTVDSSGADGADGAPGAPAADGDGIVRERPRPTANAAGAQSPRPPKRDGVPKVDPIFVKAIVGHMYVIRVVDNDSDFYVLFRLEEIVRGDNCTISWKRITSPAEVARNN